MRAMVEALNDGLIEDPDQVRRYYRLILADVQGMNRLINDLFEMSRLDAGGMQIVIEQDSLSDLISDTIGAFDALAQQQHIKLIGEISPNLDPVQMNAEKIGRVLANLISNALKYTPKDGTIIVKAWREAKTIFVSVQDSGAGFVEKDIPLLFVQFYRGEGARSRVGGSSAGLGLSIARGIVEAHGGVISAENHNGARITFTLPQA
jgi:signal transduction histidine kinase